MQKKNTKLNVRLSKDVVPVKYDIKLHPDLENFTFTGEEIITINIAKETKEITLHCKEIEINTVRLNKDFANKIKYDQKKETVTFVFPKKIPKSKHTLVINFKGILNDKMRGFYRSSYIYEGKVHNIATTQFEATDARRAFPCFDEPAQKAVFHVSLVVPKGKTAISNTLPISKIEHEAGFEVVKFSPTPKMSTYLLAFIVGDFEFIEKKSKRGVIVRVYTTPGKIHQAKFSLDTTVKVLDFYEEYFDIKYPLNTLDVIAIPDFSSGAMENWGAITYRESAILVDDMHSSLASKQWVALVIAHELAHQWFGNLVTMEWWTHLWLNEGFASYIEYLATDKLFPKWDIWTQFATADLGIALRLDSLANTHPIEIPVYHPDEIGEIFDEISYSKGASIIRMLADYLGEKNFRDGLRYYLKKHSYKNTKTIHLWQAFEKISKKPVSKMMHNWTSKSGYPVIKASLSKNKLQLSQSRFFSSPISKLKSKDKTLWQVPISLGTPSTKSQKILLDKKQTKVSYSKGNKINISESGFFRTAYSKELLVDLYSLILEKKFEPIDRLGIIRDLFALSEAGIIPTTNALEFLSAYKNEDNYTVWVEIASGLSKIEQVLLNKKIEPEFNKLIVELFTPIWKKLGWEKKENENHTDSLLRSLVISRLGHAGHEQINKEVTKMFNDVQKGKHINPDLKGVVYNLTSFQGGKKEYKTLISMYKKETLHEEKNRIGGALGNFKNEKILCEVVEFAMSENVRVQDTIGILSSIALNSAGRSVWLKALQYHWPTFLTHYGDGGHSLGRMVKAIWNTPETKHLTYLKKFFTTHKAPGATRSLEQVYERIESNALWQKRDAKSIEKFLKKN